MRDTRAGAFVESVLRDLHHSLRMLRRSPGFAVTAVLLLALGIGANAAIFSVINAVVLRALPVVEPDRLVHIARLREGGRPSELSYPVFEHVRDNLQSASGVVALHADSYGKAIVMDGETEFVTMAQVSGSYYPVLGIDPIVGRLLGPADDDLTAPDAAVISAGYWARRFGRDPAAVGATFALNERVFTIVGVAPPTFQSAQAGFAPDITLPLLPTMIDAQRARMSNHWLSVLARLKPGVTIEQVASEVEGLWSATLPAQAAEVSSDDRRAEILRQRVAALPASGGISWIRDVHARSLYVLMGTSVLVLLLACVNLSGLLLARATARQRETSVRLAIGAGRSRLARLALTENLVLAAIGGGIGVAMAGWLGTRLFTLFVGHRNDVVLSVTPDWRVLAFTAAVSLVTCLVAGLAPALQAARAPINPSLEDVRARGPRRLGRALVVAQLAISMVLVVGATLFVGTLVNLYRVDRGFDSSDVLVVDVGSSREHAGERGRAMQAELLDRLNALPGVRSATTSSVLPTAGALMRYAVQVDGYVFAPGESNLVGFNMVAPAYFETLGQPLVAGREFDARDTGTSLRVAIVTESFARHFFGGTDTPTAGTAAPAPHGVAVRSAIGRRVVSMGTSYEIVGVVGDAKYQSLREDGILKTMYIPLTQSDGAHPTGHYALRATAGDPMRLAAGAERAIRDVDPALRVRSAKTYAAFAGVTIVTERVMAALGGLFGGLALVVAAVGVFGVLAFQVERRTSEIGVRMALGATSRAMMRLVLREVTVMVVAGVAIGAGAALMVTDLAHDVLFGLTPTDPRAFAIAASILAAASLLAAWLPARRAARVNPLVALRHD